MANFEKIFLKSNYSSSYGSAGAYLCYPYCYFTMNTVTTHAQQLLFNYLHKQCISSAAHELYRNKKNDGIMLLLVIRRTVMETGCDSFSSIVREPHRGD